MVPGFPILSEASQRPDTFGVKWARAVNVGAYTIGQFCLTDWLADCVWVAGLTARVLKTTSFKRPKKEATHLFLYEVNNDER